ncbi:MAG TPA: CheR family methyltransferase, partial [Opitutales bacterium]|nr:CheR family methyltransferase [Opitutales bacterium]
MSASPFHSSGEQSGPFASSPAPITAAEYDRVRKIVYDNSRINLGPSKKELVMARLSKRLRALEIPSYAQYLDFLGSAAGRDEMTNLIDSISTNHTYFFREPQHFDFLSQVILPQFCEDPAWKGSHHFKVWSAATSSGEEPYTISLILDDYFSGKVRGWNWNILCTDISTRVLAKAEEGIFTKDRLGPVRPDWLIRYFDKGVGESDGFFRAKDTIRKNLTFKSLNLLAPSYPFRDTFHVV